MIDFPNIETQHCKLVKITEAYSDDIFEYASDIEVTRFLSWERHRTLNDTLNFIKWNYTSSKEDFFFNFGIIHKEDLKFIGTCGVSNFKEGEMDFGFVLNQKYWNKGLATEVGKAVIDFAFSHLEIRNLNAFIFAENIASIKVISKLNFNYKQTQEFTFENREFPIQVNIYTLTNSRNAI